MLNEMYDWDISDILGHEQISEEQPHANPPRFDSLNLGNLSSYDIMEVDMPFQL